MDFRSQITQIGVPVVTTARSLTVIAPLTGGGDLSADRALGLTVDGSLQVLAGALGVSALVALAAHTHTPASLGAEPALGSPDTSGFVLASTAAGVRSWLAPLTLSDSMPSPNGTGYAGSDTQASRRDHAHPVATDIAREPALGNPAVSGSLLASTTDGVRSWSALTVDAQPAFSVRRVSASAAIASDVLTKLTWTTEDQDTTGSFDLANGRCTPQAGNWQFDVCVTWNPLVPAANTYLQIILYKNGTLFLVPPSIYPTTGVSGYYGQSVSLPVIANGTDYFEVYVRQRSGGNQTVYGNEAIGGTFWSGVRIPDHSVMSAVVVSNENPVAPALIASPGSASLAARSDHVHVVSLGAVTGVLPLANGGSGANLNATGGAGKVVKQLTVGAALTVDVLAASEIPNLAWSKITTGKPTTLMGYGITDALPLSGGTVTGNMLVNGDVYAYRGATNTGVIFLNSSANRYLFYDGTNYTMPNANLLVGGYQAVTANGGTWGISVTGSAGSLASGASAGLMYVTADGNAVYFGTSSASRLNFQVGGSTKNVLYWDSNVINFYGIAAATNVLTIDGTNGRVGIRATPSYDLHLSRDSAAKPGTSTWTVASDMRSKDPASIRPFRPGLSAVRALPPPVHYRYNGLDGLPTDTEFVGHIAQSLQAAHPRMVREGPDGLLRNDYHELLFIYQNALVEVDVLLREQADAIRRLEQRIARLGPEGGF